MSRFKLTGAIFFCIIFVAVGSVEGFDILDPNYSWETYVSIPFASSAKNLAIDSTGNIHFVTGYSGGRVYKIATDKTVTILSSGFSNPQNIIWGGGTAYGDRLYVSNHNDKNIIAVELNGSKSTFSTLSVSPLWIEIDRSSNYGGRMYAGSNSPFGIYEISETGQKQLLCSLENMPISISFDTVGRYGGKMYVETTTGAPDYIGAVLKVSPDGAKTEFLSLSGHIAFDTTPDQSFGGDMFVGRRRVNPDGTYEQFIQTTPGMLISVVSFGPDGAMYFVELDSASNIVYIRRVVRVTPLPHLEGLVISGPDEVVEGMGIQYRAAACYDDGSSKDVTYAVDWSIEPETAGVIDENGILKADVEIPQDILVRAAYSLGNVDVEAEKVVSVLALCLSGSALEFDGVDDYVDLGDIFNDVELPVTISAWIFKRGDSGHRIFQSDNTSDTKSGFWFWVYLDGTLQAVYGANTGLYGDSRRSKVSDTLVANDVWTHVAAVIRGPEDMDLYINGADAGGEYEGTGGDMVHVTGANASIGWSIWGPAYYDGMIDEVRVWNVALTKEEILAGMHERLAGTEPGLIGYWNFDEGQGQVAGDSSGYGNNGILGSTPDIDNSDPSWVASDAPLGICSLYRLTKLSLEKAIAGKMASLEDLAAALNNEALSLDFLEEMLASGDLGSLKKKDVMVARANIQVAIAMENVVRKELEKSVRKLESALGNLNCEVEPQSWPMVQVMSEVRKADVNKDGVVDFDDLGIISQHWLESSETK